MPRIFHRFYAWFRGYFWLPCPICKEPYGGHEWQSGDVLEKENGIGTGVCPKCGDEARRHNLTRGKPMKIRKWNVERHPAVNPIPIAITPLPAKSDCQEYVPLLKDSEFYDRAVALVNEHNALVGENARLRRALERIIERDNNIDQTLAKIAQAALSPTGGEGISPALATEETGGGSQCKPPPETSEAALRDMMRDPRYWRDRDPAYTQRVRDGFMKLYQEKGGSRE